jgi:hypothetical protein
LSAISDQPRSWAASTALACVFLLNTFGVPLRKTFAQKKSPTRGRGRGMGLQDAGLRSSSHLFFTRQQSYRKVTIVFFSLSARSAENNSEVKNTSFRRFGASRRCCTSPTATVGPSIGCQSLRYHPPRCHPGARQRCHPLPRPCAPATRALIRRHTHAAPPGAFFALSLGPGFPTLLVAGSTIHRPTQLRLSRTCPVSHTFPTWLPARFAG